MHAQVIRIEPSIRSWNDVDAHLQRLGDLSRDLTKCRCRYESRVESLKSTMKKESEELAREMDLLARDIYLFSLTRRDDMEGRTMKLVHGAVAFRRSLRLKLPRDHRQVIQALKRLGKQACLETTERIKKVVLKKEEPSLIEAVGGRLEERDNFRIELPGGLFEYDGKLRPADAE